jgi:NADPH2:quinone reductase
LRRGPVSGSRASPLIARFTWLFLLGSDDFPPAAKLEAARAVNEALERGWPGFEIGARFPLESIAEAHQLLESGNTSGRVVLLRAVDEF